MKHLHIVHSRSPIPSPAKHPMPQFLTFYRKKNSSTITFHTRPASKGCRWEICKQL